MKKNIIFKEVKEINLIFFFNEKIHFFCKKMIFVTLSLGLNRHYFIITGFQVFSLLLLSYD